jgi:hypothetical protein
MTKINITKTAEDRYHVEVKDPFFHGEVSASQFLAIAGERTSPMPAVEIIRLLDDQFLGYTITADYDDRIEIIAVKQRRWPH